MTGGWPKTDRAAVAATAVIRIIVAALRTRLQHGAD
jgi:hypothetical protein